MAWQQWCLYKRYQQAAAAALRRKHLTLRALHCWAWEWLPRVRAKQRVAHQQAYKVCYMSLYKLSSAAPGGFTLCISMMFVPHMNDIQAPNKIAGDQECCQC